MARLWGNLPVDEDLAAAEALLRRYVRADRWAEVVHVPAARLAGRSLLEVAASDSAAVRRYVEEMFDLRRAD